MQLCRRSALPALLFLGLILGITIAASVRMRGRGTIVVLALLNLALQVFDGIATYVGWQQHGEMNPILSAGFERFGAGPTLVAAKVGAILLLFVLATTPKRSLATIGLGITFTVYTALSFVPWSQRLFG